MRSETSFASSTGIFLSVAWALAIPPAASAQRTVQYDSLAEESPAAISCGFCAGEKFGMVFRPLDGGGGLRPEEFPLTINSVQIAVARGVVSGDVLSGYECSGTPAGGTVAMTIEIYAGPSAPRGSITGYPETGPWPGETALFTQSAELTLSPETAPNMFDVMFTTVPVDAMAPAPNTYLRVVVSIPSGGTSASCGALGLSPPSAVGIRDDDGRIEDNVGFIYAVPVEIGGVPAVPGGWHWNESSSIQDPAAPSRTGIGGEWAIRLDVQPAAAPPPDGGTAMPDAGDAMPDAGSPMAELDAGASGDAGAPDECTADRDCAGGERCTGGTCVRVACTAASDCTGGMTCVAGMCRGLCTSDAECRGGEVCDSAAGHCTAARTGDAGCGCRAAGAGEGPATGALLATIGAALALAGRRRRRAVGAA